MRTPSLGVAVGTALFLTAGLARAQAPAAASKPAPELDQLAFFTGDWQCTGQAPASELGPARVTRTGITFTRELGGFAYGFKLAEVKTKENPSPALGMGFITFDAADKKLMSLATDNFGGPYVQASKGWEADKMVLDGPGTIMGQKIQAKDTFSKTSPTAFAHVYELKMGGKWVTVVDEKCQKGAAKK